MRHNPRHFSDDPELVQRLHPERRLLARRILAVDDKFMFTVRDEVPVSVARQLADKGRELARQFSGPMGPPKSLLDSTVLTADAESASPVEIPMRMIFTCTSLGFIPGFAAPIDIPRHLRVSTAGRWVRLDAPFGSVYHSTGLGLFV